MKVNSVLFLVWLTIIQAAPVAADQGLELRAAITSHRYCPVDKDVIVLLVRFKIRLANGGNAVVVVGQEPYPLLLMSRRREDLEKGKHEFELHPPDIFTQSSESSRKRSDEQDKQHRLQRGEVLETETMEVTIPTARTSKYSGPDAIPPGAYYTQLVIEPGIDGTTRFAHATSKPVEIVIEKHPKVEMTCAPKSTHN